MEILEERFAAIEHEEWLLKQGPDYIGMIHKKEYLPKYDPQTETEALHEYYKLMAAEESDKGHLPQRKLDKVVSNSTQMKDIFSP